MHNVSLPFLKMNVYLKTCLNTFLRRSIFSSKKPHIKILNFEVRQVIFLEKIPDFSTFLEILLHLPKEMGNFGPKFVNFGKKMSLKSTFTYSITFLDLVFRVESFFSTFGAIWGCNRNFWGLFVKKFTLKFHSQNDDIHEISTKKCLRNSRKF